MGVEEEEGIKNWRLNIDLTISYYRFLQKN